MRGFLIGEGGVESVGEAGVVVIHRILSAILATELVEMSHRTVAGKRSLSGVDLKPTVH